jgi:hypothetical protein
MECRVAASRQQRRASLLQRETPHCFLAKIRHANLDGYGQKKLTGTAMPCTVKGWLLTRDRMPSMVVAQSGGLHGRISHGQEIGK